MSSAKANKEDRTLLGVVLAGVGIATSFAMYKAVQAIRGKDKPPHHVSEKYRSRRGAGEGVREQYVSGAPSYEEPALKVEEVEARIRKASDHHGRMDCPTRISQQQMHVPSPPDNTPIVLTPIFTPTNLRSRSNSMQGIRIRLQDLPSRTETPSNTPAESPLQQPRSARLQQLQATTKPGSMSRKSYAEDHVMPLGAAAAGQPRIVDESTTPPKLNVNPNRRSSPKTSSPQKRDDWKNQEAAEKISSPLSSTRNYDDNTYDATPKARSVYSESQYSQSQYSDACSNPVPGSTRKRRRRRRARPRFNKEVF